MGTNPSLEEKRELFDGFIRMIQQPEQFPEEHHYAEIWAAGQLHATKMPAFYDGLQQEPIPRWLYWLLKSFHDDLVEGMTPEVLEQYRERQPGKIALVRD